MQKFELPWHDAHGDLQVSHAPIAELKYWLEAHCWFDTGTQRESFLANPLGQTKTQASSVRRFVGQN